MIENSFKQKKTGSGELRTPVSFYAYKPNDGPNPGEDELEKIFQCFCEAYSVSQKDIEILTTGRDELKLTHVNTKNAITIRIRDSFGEFYPSAENYAELHDYRFKDIRFNVVDVRPDLVENDFITVLLAVIV